MGCEIRMDLIFRIIPGGIPHNMNHQSIYSHLNEPPALCLLAFTSQKYVSGRCAICVSTCVLESKSGTERRSWHKKLISVFSVFFL